MKKERLQQTMQKYKGLQETIMNNYMAIKQIFWKKWTDYQKSSIFQDNQEETEIMNTPITNTETEAVIKNFPKNKSPGRDGFTRILSNVQRRANAYASKTLKKLQRNECFQTHSTRPPSP